MQNSQKICIIGMGHVGLPLTIAFASHWQVIGLDNNDRRILDLRAGIDTTNVIDEQQLLDNKRLQFTSRIADIADCNVYIIAVPTPVNRDNSPDLGLLADVCKTVSKVLSAGDLVVIESTVYPGCCDDYCVPILARGSNLSPGIDFDYGYSPERIRVGTSWSDPRKIKKIVSGCSKKAAARIETLYNSVIDAGTHRVSSIRTAEMSKLVENIQRDVNIALINELATVCHRMDINTTELIATASTKWDFHTYSPGLVGGHCISVDPYYLLSRADSLGIDMPLTRTARQINEDMPGMVGNAAIKLLNDRSIASDNARVLVLGLAFKENCSDIRNSKILNLVDFLVSKKCNVQICDPLTDAGLVQSMYGLELIADYDLALREKPDLVIFAVGHDEFNHIDNEMLGNALILDLSRKAPRSDWQL